MLCCIGGPGTMMAAYHALNQSATRSVREWHGRCQVCGGEDRF